ncbi:ROK family protein [Streptomyces sp. NBC_00347]|uniref:ROK family protein n=1 Tax=Streptomyces sp. NBC_00347 TaxID=2975721 RepID=UPI00225660D8|nr:ROK family protein [Streptomyces sp. NBC_00347]MCX5126783.1 ROK family protein [Streptomyces sp. NBC_00347]
MCGVGIGFPGPIEHTSGRPISPPIMPGWDDFEVPRWLEPRLGSPVLADNDVDIMALGEHRAASPEVEHLLFVKIGTGIGSGIITEHRLHRGAQRAAGHIVHGQSTCSPRAQSFHGSMGGVSLTRGPGGRGTGLVPGEMAPPLGTAFIPVGRSGPPELRRRRVHRARNRPALPDGSGRGEPW